MRVPAHASVDDAVSAVRRLRGTAVGGFANALLRQLAARGEPTCSELAVRCSAPDWLTEDALRRFGDEQTVKFLDSFNRAAPLWIRVNPLKTTRDALSSRLSAEAPSVRIEGGPGYALKVGGDDVLRTAAFAEGLFTVQDLAAQLVGAMVEPMAGERILDACGGVGGKATEIAELTGDGANIDSVDLSARKLELAAEQSRRLGLASIKFLTADLTRDDGSLDDSYDRVLLDAPCSGLGVLRRHPEAKWRPKPDIAGLAALQATMLDRVAPRVRPGGTLVYSVCTFTDEEGPSQIDAFRSRHPEFRIVAPPIDEMFVQDSALHTWPHLHDTDAFFAARLFKAG
jgi:16S rRNA (cytosine967-C5)-methyltransferase